MQSYFGDESVMDVEDEIRELTEEELLFLEMTGGAKGIGIGVGM